MAETTFLQAIRSALHEEMLADERVILIGEDIGVYGGAFKVTEGLQQTFGADRVVDTPIAEAAVVGAAAGAAMLGMRPVAELQFIDFISCGGFDTLMNVAGKSRYRNGVGCPMVVRGPAGAGGRGGAFHSTCPEMWAVSAPGIKVVFPSTPYDAKGLLKTAIRDEDPVLFLEHKFLYRSITGEVPAQEYSIPFGEAVTRRAGKDLTIFTYGAMTHTALEAARRLSAAEGSAAVDAQVIDLRTLVPLDRDGIIAAVQQTNRVLIVHEHQGQGGFAGEIAAVINEEVFGYLDGPITRVTGKNCPIGHAPALEDAFVPQVDDVVRAARKLSRY